MGKVIYSIYEIERKAKFINTERELKKDWLSKSMELVSSKTVLKDLKQGEAEFKKTEETQEKFQKLLYLQEALGYFYLGNFRSSGKDRRATKGLEETIEKYQSLLLSYFLEIYTKVEMYNLNYDILEEMSFALRAGNSRIDVKAILEAYDKNKIAFDFYKELLELKEESIELVRKKYKELIANDKSEFIVNIRKSCNEEFKKANDYLQSAVEDEESIKSLDRIAIQNSLKLIRYFNSNLHMRYKNIIYKYFNIVKLRDYFEFEYTYIDYSGLDKIYKLFLAVKNVDEKNKLVIEEELKLKMAILKYSDAFIFYNFNLFFDWNRDDFLIENLLLVEKFIRDIENSDRMIISHLTLVKELKEPAERQKKIEKIIRLVEISDLSYKKELLKRLLFIHHKNKNELNINSAYRIILTDLEKNKKYHFIMKDEIELGRSRSNEIRLNNKFIGRKHLKINSKAELLMNYKKLDEKNQTYINNKGNEIIDEKSFVYDDINEMNIGNLYTYKVINNSSFIYLKPFEDKCNRVYLDKKAIEEFNQINYILMKKNDSIYLNLQNESVNTKETGFNKNDIKVEFVNWAIVKIGNDIENTLQLGENFIDENIKIQFEKI